MKSSVFALSLFAGLALSPAFADEVTPKLTPPANHNWSGYGAWHLAVCFLWGGPTPLAGSNSCISQDYDSWNECAAAFTQMVAARTLENKTTMNLYGACTQR